MAGHRKRKGKIRRERGAARKTLPTYRDHLAELSRQLGYVPHSTTLGNAYRWLLIGIWREGAQRHQYPADVVRAVARDTGLPVQPTRPRGGRAAHRVTA